MWNAYPSRAVHSLFLCWGPRCKSCQFSVLCFLFCLFSFCVFCLLFPVSLDLTIIDCPSVFSNIHLKLTAFAKKKNIYIYLQVIFRVLLISCTAGKPATQESSLDVFCHVIFDVNIDVMDVRGRPQEFVAL